MKLKGEMEIEKIEDTSTRDDLAKARRRNGLIFMTAAEREIACENPNAGTKRPAYDYGE